MAAVLNDGDSVPVAAVTAAVGAIVLLFVLLCGLGKRRESKEINNVKESVQSKKSSESKKKKDKERDNKDSKKAVPVFNHKWLVVTLKGHLKRVHDIDFSNNNKYLVSCAEDRTILIWTVKEFDQKERRSVRGNIEFDYANQVKFSPDSKAFIASVVSGNTIQVFKIVKKPDGTSISIQQAMEFPKKHTADIINIGIAGTGKYMMSCSNDTTIIIWGLKGEVLSTIDTRQMNNNYACVSSCGRFVGSSGFTPDVKVWEVTFTKTGEFKEVARAFELKGHMSGVYHFSFSNDSHRMASISKDGTWKVWDTDIQYAKGQEPYLLLSGTYKHVGPSLIALSPDAKAIVISNGCNLSFYSCSSTKEEAYMVDVHTDPIVALTFDSSSRYLATTGDRHIRIFHNVVSLKATIKDLEEKLSKASNSSYKERLVEQLAQTRSSLNKILS